MIEAQLVAPLDIPIPAVRGFFGQELLTFQAQIRPDNIVQILGHDPRSSNWKALPADLRQMYEYLQRVTKKDRREGTASYIEDRLSPEAIAIGAFPAICIGMVSPASFDSVSGILHLELSEKNRRLMLDGLARVTGALDLIDEEVDLGNWFSFPVTFYAPAKHRMTLEQLGQLFHDFNFLQTRVAANQAIALDKSDLYIQLTNQIGRSELLRSYGGMEERAASLGAKSTALVVQRVLLRFVRGACEGRKFQESNLSRTDTPHLTKDTFKDLQQQLERFIGEFAQRMGVDRFRDRDSLHLSAPGWQVLGLVFYDLSFRLRDVLTVQTQTDVMTRLAAIDWSRYNPDWIGLVGEPERHAVTGEPVLNAEGRARLALSRAGRTTIAEILGYVRRAVGLSALLQKAEADEANAA